MIVNHGVDGWLYFIVVLYFYLALHFSW